MNAILSIKPKFVDQILAGVKTVEFRKSAFKKNVERVYIYSSAPTMRIVGYFTIKVIVTGTPQFLWKKFSSVGGIDKKAFFEYYKSTSQAVTYCIDEVVQFEEGLIPTDFIPNFVPPQSYRYIDCCLPERPLATA